MKRTALLAAVVAVAAAGCAGKSAPAPAASSAGDSASSSAGSVAASPSAAAVDQTVAITYAGGKVSGVPAVVKVQHNDTVALVVTSDVADEVHFHGYDKSADVASGGTVRIVFKATLQGRFEVELEKLKHRLVVLQVQ